METKEFKRITKYDEYTVNDFVIGYVEAEKELNKTKEDLDNKIAEIDAKIEELNSVNKRDMSPDEKEANKSEKDALRKEKSAHNKEKKEAEKYFSKWENEKARIKDRLNIDISKIQEKIETKKNEIKSYEEEIKTNEEKLDSMDKNLPEYDELVLANRTLERKISSSKGVITKYESKITLIKEIEGNLEKNNPLDLKPKIKNEPNRDKKKYKTKNERYKEYIEEKAKRTGYYVHARTKQEDENFKKMDDAAKELKAKNDAKLREELNERKEAKKTTKINNEPVKATATKATATKSEPVKATATKATATKSEPVKATATKTTAAKGESVKTTGTKTVEATKETVENTDKTKTEIEPEDTSYKDFYNFEEETKKIYEELDNSEEEKTEQPKQKRNLLNKAKGYIVGLGENFKGKIGAIKSKLRRDREEIPEEAVGEVIEEKSEIEKLEEEIKKSADRMKEYRENGFYDQQASEHEYYNSLILKMADLKSKKETEPQKDLAGTEIKWHPKLTKEQIEELISEGLEPGNNEYNMYLWNHGINPFEKEAKSTSERPEDFYNFEEETKKIYEDLKNSKEEKTKEKKVSLLDKVKGFFKKIGKTIEREIDILEAKLGITKGIPAKTTKTIDEKKEFKEELYVPEDVRKAMADKEKTEKDSKVMEEETR